MDVKVFGSQKGDTPKTPTLRAFLATTAKYPLISPVSVIFKPNKTPSFSMVTEAGYRVNVYEDNPLHEVLQLELDSLSDSNVALGIRIDDPNKTLWSLVEVPGSTSEWASYDWGYKLQVTGAKKRAAK